MPADWVDRHWGAAQGRFGIGIGSMADCGTAVRALCEAALRDDPGAGAAVVADLARSLGVGSTALTAYWLASALAEMAEELARHSGEAPLAVLDRYLRWEE